MSGEGRPILRIPSIFDSDDDSEEESPPITYRGITTTTTTTTTTATTSTKAVTETKPDSSAPPKAEQPQSLSSNSESDGESLSPKREEGKERVASTPVQSSEDSDNAEDEETDPVRKGKPDQEEEDEVENATKEDEDVEEVNVSKEEEEDENLTMEDQEEEAGNQTKEEEEDANITKEEEETDEEEEANLTKEEEEDANQTKEEEEEDANLTKEEDDEDANQTKEEEEEEANLTKEDEEEEEEGNLTKDDVNISHSSMENQEGSDDNSSSSSSSDESEEEQDRSASSGDSEERSCVVYSPGTPLSIKIKTNKNGEFSIKGAPSLKSPVHEDSEVNKEEGNDSEKEESKSEKEEPEEMEEVRKEDDNEEEMEIAATDKAAEEEEEEEEEMEVTEENYEMKVEEGSKKGTPTHEESEEEVIDEEKEEEDEDLNEEDKDTSEVNINPNSEAEESKDEEQIEPYEETESKDESGRKSTEEELEESTSEVMEVKEYMGEDKVKKSDADGNEDLEKEESAESKPEEEIIKEEDLSHNEEEAMEVEEVVDVGRKDDESDKEREIEGEGKDGDDDADKAVESEGKEGDKNEGKEKKGETETDETRLQKEIKVEVEEEEVEECTVKEKKDKPTRSEDLVEDVKTEDVEVEYEEVETILEEETEKKKEKESSGSKTKKSKTSEQSPMSVMMDTDTDSEASLDVQKSSNVTSQPKSKSKVPLRVEDVYQDSDEGSHRSSAYSPQPGSPFDASSGLQTPHPKKHEMPPTEAELADYLEAFQHGWQREIVFRATKNPAKPGSGRADIYYYSPFGKKLRSRVEIEEYLNSMDIKDLTLKNFTWMKQPLGVSKEYEKIRHACNKFTTGGISSRRKTGPGTPNSSANTSPSSTPRSSAYSQLIQMQTSTPVIHTSITTSLTKQPQQKVPSTSSTTAPPNSTPSLPTSFSVVPGSSADVDSNASGAAVIYPKKRGRGRPRKSESVESPAKKPKVSPYVPFLIRKGQGNVSPTQQPPSSSVRHQVMIQPTRPAGEGMNVKSPRPILPAPPTTRKAKQSGTTKQQAANKKSKDKVVTTGHITSLPPCPPKILTPMLMGGARQRTFHCTGTCPLGGGSVPCLHCLKCLCLFHPECTCMPPHTVSIIQSGAAKFLCPNCYWENKENMGSNKVFPHEPFEPLAQDPSSSSDSEEEGEEGREIWVEDYLKVSVRPDTPPTPPSSPSPSPSLGAWRGDGTDSRQESGIEQTQIGFVSKEMASANGHPIGSRVLEGQLVEIRQHGTGTAYYLVVQGGAAGGKTPTMVPATAASNTAINKGLPTIIIPRSQQPHPQQMPAPIIMQRPQLVPQFIPQLATPTTQMPMTLAVPPQPPVPQKPDEPPGKHYNEYLKVMSRWDNTFLGELSQRYLLVRHIFKFLSVRDLLVASQVCLQWRDLAFSSTLWETVRLRNVCVSDWTEFARFLDRRNTRNIDLRKMRLKKPDTRKTRSMSTTSLKEKSTKGKTQEGSTTCKAINKPSEKLTTTRELRGDTEEKNRKRNKRESEEASGEQSSKRRMTSETQEQDEESEEESGRLVIDEKERNSNGKDKKGSHEEEMEDVQEGEKKEGEPMECAEEEKEKEEEENQQRPQKTTTTTTATAGKQEAEDAEWIEIFTALSDVRCLRSVTLPSCSGNVLQILLASCKYITSINAMDLRHSSGNVRFDPSYLMEAPNLAELRIGSSTGFSLTSNFNFIKLQKLRVLVMRGLNGDTWPYLGTSLTTLQVGPVKTFTPNTWTNLGNMTDLKALWLEEGGSMFDSNIHDGLCRLTNLRRLCLFNFVVGPKIGQALKKLPCLERLFVLPVATEEATIRSQNSNMVVALEMLRNVEELVWGVHASDVYYRAGMDCIKMCSSKAKILSGIECLEGNLWPLHQLEDALRKHSPQSNIRIIKLDPTAASHLALAIL